MHHQGEHADGTQLSHLSLALEGIRHPSALAPLPYPCRVARVPTAPARPARDSIQMTKPRPAGFDKGKDHSRRKLTAQQDLFCREYVKDLNAKQAAIRAGYSAKNADRVGIDVLRYPQCIVRIAELRRIKSSARRWTRTG